MCRPYMLLGKEGGGALPGLGCTLLQRSGTDALPTGGSRTRDVSENGVANSNLLFVKHLEITVTVNIMLCLFSLLFPLLLFSPLLLCLVSV